MGAGRPAKKNQALGVNMQVLKKQKEEKERLKLEKKRQAEEAAQRRQTSNLPNPVPI